MIVWKVFVPGGAELLGFIPEFIVEDDPRPAKEQFNERYVSGWTPMKGFTMQPDGILHYPGDPPLSVVSEAKLRDEVIRVYHYAWVSITQPDGSFEVCRMD